VPAPLPPRGSSLGSVFSLGLLSSLLTALAAALRSKVVALALGPVGVGIAAEITQIATLATIPASFAAGPALVRAVASGDERQSHTAYDTAWTFALAAGALALPVAALAAWLTLPASWGVPVVALTTISSTSLALTSTGGVMGRVLVAAKHMPRFTAATIATTLVMVATTIAGTWSDGLRGYFWGGAAGALLSMGVWAYALEGSRSLARVVPRLGLHPQYVREVASLGGASLAGMLGSQVALYVVRTALGRFEGPAANGLFQACWSFDSIYLSTVLGSLGNFIFPRYAAAPERDALARELSSAARFVLMTIPPIVLAGLAVRPLILSLLYSKAFVPAEPLLALILCADIAKTVCWCQDGALLYRGKVRAYVSLQIVGWGGFAVASGVLVKLFGLVGVGWAYFGVYVLQVELSRWMLRRELAVTIDGRKRALVFLGVGLAFSCSRLPGGAWQAVPAVLTVAWGAATGGFTAIIGRLRPGRRLA